MKVAGIDPSLSATATTIIAGDNHATVLHGSSPHEPSTANRIRRFVNLAEQVASSVEGCSIVAVESYSYASVTRLADAAEYGGLLRAKLFDVGVETIHEVAPLSLKKWATGKGAGGKAPLIAAMARRYGVQFATDDEFDSFALAQLCTQLAGLSEPQTAYQAEVVEKILAGPKPKRRRKAA